MTLLEILRTAMGMPPPPPDISQPDDEQRVFPLGRGKLTAEEFRYTLALAEGGDVAARLCVGLLYYRGLGVRPNLPQAYKWLSLAAEQGDPKAAEFQQVLLQAMTPDEIANSRCLIARFKGEPEPEFNNEEIHFESPEEISTSTADTEQMVYGFKSWQPRPVGQEHEPFEPSARPPSVTHAATAPRPVVPPKPAAQIPPPAVTVQPAPATKSSRGMLWLLTLVILGGVSMGAWLYFHSPAQEVKRDPVPPIEPVTNAAFSMPKMRLAPPSNAIEQPVDSAERMLFAPKKSEAPASDRRELIASLNRDTAAPKPGPAPAGSIEKIRTDAEAGQANAQFLVGLSYVEGKDVTQDFTNAVKWFTKASEQGQPDAQNNLGICYIRGTGVKKDLVLAYKWIALAVAGGNRDALPNRDRLATMLKPDQLQEAKRLTVEFINALPVKSAPANNPAPP